MCIAGTQTWKGTLYIADNMNGSYIDNNLGKEAKRETKYQLKNILSFKNFDLGKNKFNWIPKITRNFTFLLISEIN